MTDRLSYIEGPLGYAVLLDGKPWGRISDRRNLHAGWQVSVPTLNAATAVSAGLFQGRTVFRTLRLAKEAIVASLGSLN